MQPPIAGHYDHLYGRAVDPGQVLVTVGASGAFVLALLAAFDPAIVARIKSL
jgi:aspartate/methionine/tyrosine aminotransferase